MDSDRKIGTRKEICPEETSSIKGEIIKLFSDCESEYFSALNAFKNLLIDGVKNLRKYKLKEFHQGDKGLRLIGVL